MISEAMLIRAAATAVTQMKTELSSPCSRSNPNGPKEAIIIETAPKVPLISPRCKVPKYRGSAASTYPKIRPVDSPKLSPNSHNEPNDCRLKPHQSVKTSCTIEMATIPRKRCLSTSELTMRIPTAFPTI